MKPIEEAHKYFNKAKFYYKIAFFDLLCIIFFSLLYLTIKAINPIIAGILAALPLLTAYVIVPLGFIYLVRSYKNKEPFHKYRLFYLVGYLFFLFLLVVLVISVTNGIKQLALR